VTCKETQILLSAHLDRELKAEELHEVRLHLADCAACKKAESELLRLKETLRMVPMPRIPDDLVAAIEAETILKPHWWESWSLRKTWTPALIATAAALGAWALLKGHVTPLRHSPWHVVQAPTVISTAPAVAMHRDQEPDDQIH
jgi:predicted anti-sigma-YlaC factor YlaD